MKGLAKYKVKSAALQFAIYTSVLIALLLGGLILYVYTAVYLKNQSKAAIENIQLSDSGINYMLKTSIATWSDTLRIPTLENDNQKVKASLSYWGIFKKAYIKTIHHQKFFVKTALFGTEINSQTDPTLFLQETYNPLSVVGETKITGNAFLPIQGVKAGYIAGQSYYGNQLIYGKIKRSEINLPKIEKEAYERLIYYLKSYQPAKTRQSIRQTNHEIIVNSFSTATKDYYSNHPIELANTKLIGNIVIKSDVSIHIKKSAKLTDVVLIAPEILIDGEVNGNFQCIASKKIKLGKSCHLAFPSALILFQDNKDAITTAQKSPFDNKIYIDKQSIIKGTVSYIQTKEFPDFNTQLVLENDAKIKGQVYCQGNFELKGTVSGCVYTKQFISNTAGSIFVNHILDGTIENENIPSIYSGIILENHRKTVLKWLY